MKKMAKKFALKLLKCGIISSKMYLSMESIFYHRKYINFKNPKSFNEKIKSRMANWKSSNMDPTFRTSFRNKLLHTAYLAIEAIASDDLECR